MHKRYNDLKKRCKRYYLKRYLRTVLILLVAAAAAAGGMYYGFIQDKTKAPQLQQEPKQTQKPKPQPEPTETKEQKATQETNTSDKARMPEQPKQPEQTAKDPEPRPKSKPETKTEPKEHKLEPVYNFEIDALYEQTLPQKRAGAAAKKQRPKQPGPEAAQPETAKEPAQAPKQDVQRQKQKPAGSKILIESKTAPTIEEKKAIYANRPDYGAALEIALQYYQNRQYEHAITWAKKADSHRSSSQKVFALYAKSLYFSGRPGKAAQLLRYYLGTKSSQKLQNLLEKIEQNTLDKED